MIEHQPRRFSRILARADGHEARRHHRLDRQTREQVVDLPNRQARRRRREVQPNVAVRDDAEELWPYGDQHVTETLVNHELTRVEHRRLRTHGDRASGHQVADLHGPSS